MPLAKKKRNYQVGGPVQQMMPQQGMPFDPNLGQSPQGMPFNLNLGQPPLPPRGYQIGGPVQQMMPPRMPQGMPPQGMPPMMPPQGMQMPLQGMPPQRGYQIGGPVQQRMPPQGMPFDPNLGQPPQGMPPMPPQGMPPQGMPMPPPRGMPKGMPMMPQRGIASFNSGGSVEDKETDRMVREMWGIMLSDVEKAEKKAGKKAKRKEKRKVRKAGRAGKPKITKETGLAAPWVIEEEIIRPSGMQLGGPVQQRMPPMVPQGMPPMPPQGMPPMPPQGMPPMPPQGMPPMPPQGMPPQGMPPMMPQGMPMMPQRGYQLGGQVQQRMPPQGMPFDPNLGQPLPPQGMPPMMPPQGMPPPRGMPKGMPMMPQRGIASFNSGRRVMPSQGMPPMMPPQGMPPMMPQEGLPSQKGPSIRNINKRLKKLEGQSISDKDLDDMTKMNRAVSDKDKKRGRTISDKDIGGINTMKEKTFDYISPEQQTYMADVIRREAVKDPELDDEQRALIPQMTDNQIMEMVDGILAESQNQEEGEETIEDKAVRLLEPLTEGADEARVLSANTGGRIQGYNLGGLASMGRGGDSQLAHVMPGERMVPPGVIDDGMMDAAFVKAGLDPREYTVGSAQASTNPMTGVPEYGLFSFIKRLFKKVKKLAPIIGATVGFAYGGPKGAGIGKAIGGVLKSGDVDFQDVLTDFGTGWALGSFAKGVGLQEGSVFKKASEGGMWGIDPTAGEEGVGGFIQSAGAKLAGGEDIDLMDKFKNLSTGKKLGVIALGLGALSQTGMFDKEELGDIPPELRARQQDIYDYIEQPLRPAVQGEWGAGPTTSPEALTDWKSRIAKSQKTKSSLADFFEDKIGLTGYPAFS